MERKIGEIFKIDSDWYQCIVGNGCDNCAFNEINCDDIVDNGGSIGYCYAHGRKDNKSVIFKKLEKVGEPFYLGKKLMQNYKVFVEPYIPKEIEYFIVKVTQDLIILVEIKQKEDMKKMKLKPFDLEAAKAGKPVCTRDGRKARIICFDVRAKKPIAALITNDDIEEVHFYYGNGRSNQYQEYRYDLMMLPEKKEGWVNVYKDGDNNYRSTIYTNEKVALSRKGSDCITTIKIEWEE